MKRFRVIPGYWDGRPILLRTFKGKLAEPGSVNENTVLKITSELQGQFGTTDFPNKLERFLELPDAPFSIVNEHNQLLRDCRNAFVAGFFYSALVGACALGERILNSIILNVRDNFKSTPEYKSVYKKKSFDDWTVPIRVLVQWKIIDSAVSEEFHELKRIRNKSIHYNSDLQKNLRTDGLKAITQVSKAVETMFTATGKSSFLHSGTGFAFIKKEAEDHPMVKSFYIPNCIHVGPNHLIKGMDSMPWKFEDQSIYPDKEISDDEFVKLYDAFIKEHTQKR